MLRRAGDVAAQASSAFHRVQGSTPAQIASLNGAIARLHGSRGRAYSFQIAQEEISEASLTRLAHWLGFPSCAYTRVPRANDGSVGGEYHTDAGAVGVSCEHATSAAEPTATTAEPSIADLTFGIKHTAGFLERRGHLPSLLSSIRERYREAPIIVAYDGKYNYDPIGKYGEAYVKLGSSGGLSAGRNAIVKHAMTEVSSRAPTPLRRLPPPTHPFVPHPMPTLHGSSESTVCNDHR